MDLIHQIIVKAQKQLQRIVLSVGTEERTLKAADQLLADQVATIILLGNPEEIKSIASDLALKNIDKAVIVDPKNHTKKEAYTNLLVELRKKKGMTYEQAAVLVEKPLYLACLMIKSGDADGEVAGALSATGDVLRPAFQIVKTQPGIKSVSGAFLMFLPDTTFGKDGLLVFADCAVNPVPSAEQLGEIAVCSARTAKDIAGIEPKVAMLSFSTKGSAKHEVVDKVTTALAHAKELDATLLIDGELQVDAALVPSIAQKKAPNSVLQGNANVLIFPSLEAGNIGYKLVQRLAHADAVGPILQGIAAPINDLSRGCSPEDIYKMVAITANQAIGIKNQQK